MSGWTGPTARGGATPAPARPAFERIVSADHPDQRVASGGLVIRPLSLRFDPTHELPLIVYDGAGKVLARFATAYEAAAYLDARQPHKPLRRVTLPLPIAEQI